MSTKARELIYEQYGNPAEVLKIVEKTVPEPKGKQVLVKILAASVNPADKITITGSYGIKPELPAVGGNEFVAEVLALGNEVKSLSVGQRVVPFVSGLGTWRTHALYLETQLMPISEKIGLVEAATLTVNPCTAYRMLKDFVDLKPGDCIIQNGANSAVGQVVHQLCKAWGIHSVGIVRERPELNALKEWLKGLGATEVLTEQELLTTQIFENGKLPAPRLALECVGGKSAGAVALRLAEKGVMVTYGSLSREPLEISSMALIYKDIALRGFWRTRWTKENHDSPLRAEMFNELCQLIENKRLVGPMHELIPLADFKRAFSGQRSEKDFTGRNFILDMS